ncbi:MAG: hypothetical protein AAFR61_12410 [Bacteroidota bacterium]
MRVILLFLVLVSTVSTAVSQQVLSLEHNRRFKRIVFKPGDYIRFQTHDSNAQYNGYVESVGDSILVLVKAVDVREDVSQDDVFRDYIPIKEISVVYNGRKTYWRFFKNMYSGTAMIGGGILIAITTLNSIIEKEEPDPQSLIIAAGISFSGFLVRRIGRDKYKIGKKWSLTSLDSPLLLEAPHPHPRTNR